MSDTLPGIPPEAMLATKVYAAPTVIPPRPAWYIVIRLTQQRNWIITSMNQWTHIVGLWPTKEAAIKHATEQGWSPYEVWEIGGRE